VGQCNVLTKVERRWLKAMAVMESRGGKCHSDLPHVLGALPVPFLSLFFELFERKLGVIFHTSKSSHFKA